MNNVYYILGKYGGCNYVRGLLPMWFNGWTGNKTSLEDKDQDTVTARNQMLASDVVVFHRPETRHNHKLAVLLKEQGKKIVFDNDDTYRLDKSNPFFGRNVFGMKENTEIRNNLLYNFVTNTDLVTTTTKTLAKEYSKYNKNVVVIPNCINEDDWGTPLRNETDKIRIGIVGSTAYTQDALIIRDTIKELANRDNVQLVMFGLQSAESRKNNPMVEEVYDEEYKFWDSITNLEHVPWTPMKNYFDTLNELRLDIMLIPRKKCYFNQCKSNVKFLEAAMCEIPVVASSFKDSPYEELDGEIGIKLKNTDDWLRTIDVLIKNKEIRRSIGRKAREYVIKNYNIKDKKNLWVEAYNKLTQ